MAKKERFDESVSKWLQESAPARIPERVLNATFERTRQSRQQMGWHTVIRRLSMPKFLPALGSAAVIVVVAALALGLYVNRQGGIGAPPSPTPSSSPTVAASRSVEPTAPPSVEPSAAPSVEPSAPIVLSYASADGEVTASAPSTWNSIWSGKDGLASDVWSGLLWPGPGPCCELTSEVIGLVDPVAYDSWCAANGESPLLSAPAGATAIAQQVIADPNFETTAPVAARVGGLEAVSIDVALAPGGEACRVQTIEISRWIHHLQTQPGTRLRLYLVDLPEGMSVETLAITVVALEERFEAFIAETAPIIESIEFHPGAP